MVGFLVFVGYLTCCAVFVESLFGNELEQQEQTEQ